MSKVVKNPELRKLTITTVVVLIFIAYIFQLIFLQIVDDTAKDKSQKNVVRSSIRYPARGLIYDRNGKLLVYNKAAYDLMVVPRNVRAFDTLDLCNTLNIELDVFKKALEKSKSYSGYRESVLISQLTSYDFAKLQEKLFRFQGFHVRQRTQRAYTTPYAAHCLGYLSEVTETDIQRDDYYTQGDNIGNTGVEYVYEKELRGEKGRRYSLVNRKGAVQGAYHDGEEDILPIPGKDLILSIDRDLQAYGEQLMQNKVGSIVAIEPATGEILCLVSSPGYDLTKLVGRVRGENYQALLRDSLKPLYNRILRGRYSPGSTFKMVNGLVGMQTGAINNHLRFSCEGKVSRPIVCTHYHQTPLKVDKAVCTSCNPFFWKTFKATLEGNGQPTREGYTTWYNHVKSFGFGSKLGIDLPSELKGNLPSTALYDKIYGKRGWRAITVRSLAIGQGELVVTPLQLANEAAIIANRGYYYPPHLVKHINGKEIDEKFTTKQVTSIDTIHFTDIIRGMQMAYTDSIGTARFYRNKALDMCGKTGTVQNNHGPDHSAFICFAPRVDPKIAVCVIVENGGYGTYFGAPIGTLVMHKYLGVNLTRYQEFKQDSVFNADLIHRHE